MCRESRQGGGTMKTIELAESEVNVMIDTLTSALSELRTEIRRTDNREFHDELKRKEAVMGTILHRIQAL